MRTTIARHSAADGRWLVATRAPRGPLGTAAAQLVGYEERTPGPLDRREVPIPRVVVIVDLGSGLRVESDAGSGRARFHATGFVAGMTDRPAMVGHTGFQTGVQVDLCPTFARRAFGVSMHELVGRTVDLDALLPRGERGLRERVGHHRSWDARLGEVEATFGRLGAGPADVGSRVVAWALGEIERTGGQIAIDRLTLASGYSHRQLGRLFGEHVGMSPKLVARVARLNALRARLQRTPRERWARLAAVGGFSDQSHLGREVRDLVGLSPGAWRAELLGPRGWPEMTDSSQSAIGDDASMEP